MIPIPNQTLGVFPIHSDPEPLPNIVTDLTNTWQPVATTETAHGYESGWIVSMYVPMEYRMYVPLLQTKIEVLSDTTFKCLDLDLTFQPPFTQPVFPPPFTAAQVVPLSGITRNVARSDGRL